MTDRRARRGRFAWTAILTIAAMAASIAIAQEGNILTNTSFEEMADGKPANWRMVDYGSGGKLAVGTDGGHSGKNYASVTAGTTKQRGAFMQKVAVPKGTRHVAFGGWYRTHGIDDTKGRGASLRILFHRSVEKWDEITLRPVFFPPSADWKEVHALFELPEGTVAVVMETFNFFAPGRVDWDDVWLRPATQKDLDTAAAVFNPGEEIDRDPQRGVNKPYSPADGSRVTLNPPPFLWLPSGKTGAVTYRLQIDTSPKFNSGDLIEYKDMVWRCKMLTRQLKPGTWHWRYGVDKKGPRTVWSKTRTFTVPEDAAPWVYPGRDGLQVGARPRLFVKPGGLAELRRRARDGDLQRVAETLVARSRTYATQDLRPEPPFQPKDIEKRRAVWREIIRWTRPAMDAMENSALAYLLTGDKPSGLEAKRRLLHFFKWNPTGSTDIMHNDEPAMWVMMRGSRAYDWTYDLFTPEERKIVEDSMRIRARRFYEQLSGMPYDNRPYSSHPSRTIGFLGEAAISFLPDWPEARDYLEYITQIYWGVYPAWGTDDGGWNEGPGYWSGYMGFGLHFVMALREATGVDLGKRPFFHNTPYYRLYITPPHTAMSPFGDGTQWKPSVAGGLMYEFSSLNHDPIIRWYADQAGAGPGASILGILLKDDSLKGEPPVDLQQGVLFDGVGLVSLHTDLADGDNDVHFAFKSSPYGAVSHGHNEQNCFVLEAYGSALAVNTGYYNQYGTPHHDKWTRQTKAKNGITIDGGESQDRGWHATGKILSFVHGNAFDLIAADATKAWGGRLDKCIREVVHVRPDIFVIRDDLADDEAHNWEFRLHGIHKMDVNAKDRTIFTKENKATLLTRFLVPRNAKIDQTDQFDPPPKFPPNREWPNNWHTITSTPEKVKTAEFLTVLQVSRPGENPEPAAARYVETDSVRGVELKHEDGSRTLVGFAKVGAKAPYSLEGIHTDAPIFAVTWAKDGDIAGWLARTCRILRVGGKDIVRAEKPMTVTAMPEASAGRIDTDGHGGQVAVWWPWKARYLTRNDETTHLRGDDGTLQFTASYGRDRVTAWEKAPGKERKIAVEARFGDKTMELEGRRYLSGISAVSGKLDVPGGIYQAPDLPKSARLQAGRTDAEGRLWIAGNEGVTLTGRNLPSRVVVPLVTASASLPADAQARMPSGASFEAEANWTESSSGGVSVSDGGHQNTSGGNNLWAWNTPDHTIEWTLDLPESGAYELWVVGASEVGLLADLRMDGGASVPLWFEPTGGWGRAIAAEWAAFHVADVEGKPVVFTLDKGAHRLRITNRSGLGLNLDRFVLVKR